MLHSQRDRQDRAGGSGGVAGGKVDLAQQQNEDQAHRDHDDHRGLRQEVGHVEGGQERAALENGEQNQQGDEAEHRRQ